MVRCGQIGPGRRRVLEVRADVFGPGYRTVLGRFDGAERQAADANVAVVRVGRAEHVHDENFDKRVRGIM